MGLGVHKTRTKEGKKKHVTGLKKNLWKRVFTVSPYQIQ